MSFLEVGGRSRRPGQSSATSSTFVIAGAKVDHSATLNLTDTSISTSRAGTPASAHLAGGLPTFCARRSLRPEKGASGVASNSGGAATLSGGSVATSGADAPGLQASGAGSSISTSNGMTVSTTGVDSLGVQADTGGAVT
jgi:hypothetical protein